MKGFSRKELRGKLGDMLWKTERCYYSGIRMNKVFNSPFGKSLDRVDNDQGYTATNTVVCCRWVNSVKAVIENPSFSGWTRKSFQKTLRGLRKQGIGKRKAIETIRKIYNKIHEVNKQKKDKETQNVV